MKKTILLSVLFFFALPILAQNNWNLIWTLQELPFIQPPGDTIKVASEMSMVKGGFDTDEDGWGEFLCAWSELSENYILMYEANGDNTYELVWYFKYPVSANTFSGFAVGDIDNNGKVDIVTTMPSIAGADPNPPRLWFFEWNGVQGENKYGSYVNNISEPTSEWNFNVPDDYDLRPYSNIIEDIDNDGINELITGVRLSNPSSLRQFFVSSVNGELSGFGSWQVEYNFQQEFGGSLYSVTTGDLDNDGNKEIYAFVWDMFTLRIFECTGDGQYNLAFEVDNLYQDSGIDYGALDAVRVADVNNDGVNELYIAGTEAANTLFIATNITDVNSMTSEDIKEFYHIPKAGLGGFRAMHIADPDKDGNLSLLIAGEKNGQIYDLEYKGEGDPTDSTSWDLQVIFDVWELSGMAQDAMTPRFFYGYPTGDMDQDGKDEYVFVNYSSDFSIWADDFYVAMIEIGEPTGVATNEKIIPGDISLSQNYPNPFNPTTIIEFGLNESAETNLIVYDILGREITTLVNEILPAGTHRVNFDASQLTAGTYFYTLRAGNKVLTNKMILLK